jgi:beta-lactam-binding protein with PASTA domain
MPKFVIGDRVYISYPGSRSHNQKGTVINIIELVGQDIDRSSNITVTMDNSHYTVDVNCFSGIGIEHITQALADKSIR